MYLCLDIIYIKYDTTLATGWQLKVRTGNAFIFLKYFILKILGKTIAFK